MGLDIKNINKKIVLIFLALGFVLSFFAGLISGNNFINVFFRSLISGLVVGVIVAVANIVIMIFLPELLESQEEYEEEGDSQVDIVMPEEGYTVQRSSDEESDSTETYSDSGSETPNENFKEVTLDNLDPLTSSAPPLENDMNGGSEDVIENGTSSSYTAPVESDFGKHSPEEMAKAVKSVLKKD